MANKFSKRKVKPAKYTQSDYQREVKEILLDKELLFFINGGEAETEGLTIEGEDLCQNANKMLSMLYGYSQKEIANMVPPQELGQVMSELKKLKNRFGNTRPSLHDFLKGTLMDQMQEEGIDTSKIFHSADDEEGNPVDLERHEDLRDPTDQENPEDAGDPTDQGFMPDIDLGLD